jgi:hypothetical protein
MSRLFDRIHLEGIRPWKFTDWPPREIHPHEESLPDVARLPMAIECASISAVEGAEVFVADDVALYLSEFSESIRSFDIITQVTPPFPRMFIEFKAIGIYKERHGLYSWGVLVEETDFLKTGELLNGARWGLTFTVLFEPRKGYICGPVATSCLFALPDGSLDRFSPEGKAVGGHRWVDCSPQWFEAESNDQFTEEIEQALWELMVPALFTISLLHSRNVIAEEVERDARLDRKYFKRTGSHLFRYKELKIEPLRQMLAKEGANAHTGLERAVHVCRGHFKRYSEESPLFGRFTGQWWWSSYRRGNSDFGEIEKDYEVRLSGFGATYRRANEHPNLVAAVEAKVRDPDSAGRGPRAHNMTQNMFADCLDDFGIAARSPNANEDEYDIGWKINDVTWIGEVKSITDANEETQLRAALAQLLRYRQSIAQMGYNVRTVVIAEREPSDLTWSELLSDNQICLTFPGNFNQFISDVNA